VTERKDSMFDDAELPASVDPKILIGFAERKQRILDDSADLKRRTAKLLSEEADILAMLSHAGVPRVTVKTANGNRTIGFIRNVYSSKKEGVETAAVIAVLDELHLEDFHKEGITLQSINAWLREQYELGNEIPEPLKAVLNTDPSYRVGVTKS
jgi:hypothetical protein